MSVCICEYVSVCLFEYLSSLRDRIYPLLLDRIYITRTDSECPKYASMIFIQAYDQDVILKTDYYPFASIRRPTPPMLKDWAQKLTLTLFVCGRFWPFLMILCTGEL